MKISVELGGSRTLRGMREGINDIFPSGMMINFILHAKEESSPTVEGALPNGLPFTVKVSKDEKGTISGQVKLDGFPVIEFPEIGEVTKITDSSASSSIRELFSKICELPESDEKDVYIKVYYTFSDLYQYTLGEETAINIPLPSVSKIESYTVQSLKEKTGAFDNCETIEDIATEILSMTTSQFQSLEPSSLGELASVLRGGHLPEGAVITEKTVKITSSHFLENKGIIITRLILSDIDFDDDLENTKPLITSDIES